jgi:hypothetical protein
VILPSPSLSSPPMSSTYASSVLPSRLFFHAEWGVFFFVLPQQYDITPNYGVAIVRVPSRSSFAFVVSDHLFSASSLSSALNFSVTVLPDSRAPSPSTPPSKHQHPVSSPLASIGIV